MITGILFVVLLVGGCGLQQSAVGDPISAPSPASQKPAAPNAAPGPYEISRSLLQKHGVGIEGALSLGACPLVPVSVLADAIPGIGPADSIIGTKLSNASPVNEGTASMTILLNPEHLAPHLLRSREVWCDECKTEGLRCYFYIRVRAFDENPAEAFELENTATVEEGLQVVRLYNAGSIRFVDGQSLTGEERAMRVIAVGRVGRGFEVRVSNEDGNWSGRLQLRISKTRSGPRLEVSHAEFGGV